jgi:vacuolar-type H+-ATPase subunit E/Vma4
MSIENIEKRVLDSANDEAARAVDDAKKQAKQQRDAAREKNRRRAEQAEQDARDEFQQKLEQQVTSARAANKLKLLGEKSELLDDIFHKAVEKFIGDRGGDYQKWLAGQVDAVGDAAGTVVPAEPDRAAVEKLVADRDGLSLSDESLPLRGGFMLRGEKIDMDMSLDTLLTDLRDQLVPELAAKAFTVNETGQSE